MGAQQRLAKGLQNARNKALEDAAEVALNYKRDASTPDSAIMVFVPAERPPESDEGLLFDLRGRDAA